MSFFKLNIQKLLEKIPSRYAKDEKVVFNDSQWGLYKGLEEHRFWVHIAARRTGKSFGASILALAKLLEPNQQVIVVAPNFTLSSIIWDYVTDLIQELKIECDRFNQKDKVIKLINGSTFRLLSANNRDSLVGRAANFLIVDEAAVIDDDEYFTRDLRPALSTFNDSRALFITTPRGKNNYIYEYFNRGPDERYPEWGSSLYTWRSNPRLSLTDIEEAKSIMSSQLFKQEYECEWATFEGQVYAVDETRHLQDLSEIQPKDNRFDFIGGLDLGYRDETVFLVVATDGEHYYVVDEYISKEATTSTHAEHFRALIDNWGVSSIYIDSAAQQMRADLAYEYDIYCENANKYQNEGITHLQVLLEQNRLMFHVQTPKTYQSMCAYRWNDRGEKQKPLHDWSSHCCDALRYAIYTHAKNKVSIYG